MLKLKPLDVLKNKPLQKQLDDKMHSLKMLIRSRVPKKGTFTLKGADDETAYFKTLSVLKEEISELEEKICGKCNCLIETMLDGTVIVIDKCKDCESK